MDPGATKQAIPLADHRIGEDLVGEQNIFLSMLSAFTVNGVSPEDVEVYQYPWPEGSDLRLPEFAAQVFPNTRSISLVGAGHFVQEDLPNELGQAINESIDDVG